VKAFAAFLMDLRETGDYGGLARVTEQDAQRAVEAAQRILAACQKTQPELAQP
jgi:HEPN domain-containing protein